MFHFSSCSPRRQETEFGRQPRREAGGPRVRSRCSPAPRLSAMAAICGGKTNRYEQRYVTEPSRVKNKSMCCMKLLNNELNPPHYVNPVKRSQSIIALKAGSSFGAANAHTSTHAYAAAADLELISILKRSSTRLPFSTCQSAFAGASGSSQSQRTKRAKPATAFTFKLYSCRGAMPVWAHKG